MTTDIKIGMRKVGEVTYLELDNNFFQKIYKTTRNARKRQIYLYKQRFLTTNGKLFYGKNCIGISNSVCKKLVIEDIKEIHFSINNFPADFNGFTGKISFKDFLLKSAKVKENYEEERIIPLNELKMVNSWQQSHQ